MSVLNQSGEEQVECPLCMEPLEVDDLNFYPCTCGYQICRFCWHRIRTDENGGLCPACRKAYSENPADFIPLSQEQVAKLKAEKRQRDQQRKAKLTENRKHLASVRVVQRNLVFVVGLPVRLADPEVLKRHEYFGKFGKIHKVVINQSTTYAGAQGPSASAYVTYLKSDDALRAIQSVNNIYIDGRLIKSSLGTTKYCSHFLKNQACPKSDCMYLHDYGDLEASFTKEEMHAGKHQEYEKKLHESMLMRTNNNNNNNQGSNTTTTTTSTTNTSSTDSGKTSSAPIPTTGGGNNNKLSASSRDTNGLSSSVSSSSSTTSSGSERDRKDKNKKGKTKSGNNEVNWKDKKERSGGVKNENRTENGSSNSISHVKEKSKSPSLTQNGTSSSTTTTTTEQHEKSSSSSPSTVISSSATSHSSSTSSSDCNLHQQITNKLSSSVLDDNTSFFSSNSFQKLSATPPSQLSNHHNRHIIGDGESDDIDTTEGDAHPTNILTDTLPNINTTEDWAAAFGFPRPAEPIIDVIGKREENTPPIDSFRSRFGPLRQDHEFSKGIESSYNGFYDIPSKMQDNILDILSSNATKKNGLIDHLQQQQHHHQRLPPPPSIPSTTTTSTGKPLLTPSSVHQQNNAMFDGLDENMSKFFMNFHKNLKDLNSGTANTPSSPLLNGTAPTVAPPPSLGQQPQQHQDFINGFNGIHHNQNSFYSGFTTPADRLVMLQQKQMEEQFLNLSLKQAGFGGNVSNPVYQNGLTQPPNGYVNGENGFGHLGGGFSYGGGLNVSQMATTAATQKPKPPAATLRSSNEDDLGFDPFKETQKAFAELMASEQNNHKLPNTGRNQMNGVVYNNGSHLPPPPPGFIQSNPHMNSFGSKILPYLNMSSSQQQLNSQTQNSWPPNNFSSQLQTQQQQNSTTNTCNDWKVLDPAILSSSQHYPLANMSTIRDYTTNLNQQLQNGHPPHLRSSFDYNNVAANTAFSNAFAQLQPNINNFTQHLNTQQQNRLNWFTSADINSQISSPPGFRTNPATKQQEC